MIHSFIQVLKPVPLLWRGSQCATLVAMDGGGPLLLCPICTTTSEPPPSLDNSEARLLITRTEAIHALEVPQLSRGLE